MDMEQTVQIPLKEYLELKDAFDHKRSIRIDRQIAHTGKGYEGLVTSALGWKNLDTAGEPEVEKTLTVTGELDNLSREYNRLFETIVNTIKDYDKFRKFDKDVTYWRRKPEGISAREWFIDYWNINEELLESKKEEEKKDV